MPIKKAKNLGTTMRAERTRLGLTQYEVAVRAKITLDDVAKIESGLPEMDPEKALSALRVLNLRLTPTFEEPTAADQARATKIAWSMGLEKQALNEDGYGKVLDKIVVGRLSREASGSQTKRNV